MGATDRRPGPLVRGLLVVLSVAYSISAFVAPTAHVLDTGYDGFETLAHVETGTEVQAGLEHRLDRAQDPVPPDPHHHDLDCVTCLLQTLSGVEGQGSGALVSATSASLVLDADGGYVLDRSLPTLHLRGPPTA